MVLVVSLRLKYELSPSATRDPSAINTMIRTPVEGSSFALFPRSTAQRNIKDAKKPRYSPVSLAQTGR